MESAVETPQNNNQLKVKQKIEGKVAKTSLQGAVIDINHKLPGYLHVSRVVDSKNPEQVIKSLEDVLKEGDTVTVWVKQLHKDRIDLTMIEPLALDWREITPDKVLRGKVVRLESFGAFVELGAERPGLVHVSELSHTYVKVPSELLKVGDEVDVKVLEVDRRKKQIKLSIKALQEEPETAIEEKRPARKGKAAKKEEAEESQEEVIPDPTFMEIALRQAMDRAEKRKPASIRAKCSKSYDSEVDDIFDRTMRNKLSD